ncbi:leukocyte cell-derived chemotaxin-2-like [Myxocyprinus asiaticus]|uniref:leukocyte cell-derived chemotaxin-2-like n=1 Tax=Myxocyprinus asiaticus TaxID=70543 RepID=UPI002221D2B5|nr:leukocyte cell-derived chemotaxin-2-like [Myxocyprinus asiaticus]
MRLYIFFLVFLLAVLSGSQVDSQDSCMGNPKNKIRGCDRHGCGHYGARRKGGKHLGLDIECKDGATVKAPFDVTLNGKAIPYNNKSPIDNGINLRGKGLCFKLFYVKPDSYYGIVRKGQRIGTMLPMQRVYPGITSHVHVQMCDKSDPTKYF